MDQVTVHLKIRRYYNYEQPEVIEKTINLNTDSDYYTVKSELQNICQVKPEDNKIIKLRREDGILVPFSFLIKSPVLDKYYYVDICHVNSSNKVTANLLQDAYINSVCEKLHNMETRISKAELLLPQLEWKQQSYIEDIVNSLTNRVSFLNRRIDELLPANWKKNIIQPKI